MLWKCCTQYASKFGKLSSGHRSGKGQFSFQSQRQAISKNVQPIAQLHSSQQWPQVWKRSVFIPIPKTGNIKECSNYCTIALISRASKIMLKILQASFISTWILNFSIFKLDLEKAEEPEIKLPTSAGSSKKLENSRKTSASLTMPKPLTLWITTNCGKFFKRWEYQTTSHASWRIYM